VTYVPGVQLSHFYKQPYWHTLQVLASTQESSHFDAKFISGYLYLIKAWFQMSPIPIRIGYIVSNFGAPDTILFL